MNCYLPCRFPILVLVLSWRMKRSCQTFKQFEREILDIWPGAFVFWLIICQGVCFIIITRCHFILQLEEKRNLIDDKRSLNTIYKLPNIPMIGARKAGSTAVSTCHPNEEFSGLILRDSNAMSPHAPLVELVVFLLICKPSACKCKAQQKLKLKALMLRLWKFVLKMGLFKRVRPKMVSH